MGGGDKDSNKHKDTYPFGVVFAVYIQPAEDAQGNKIEFSESNWTLLRTLFIRGNTEKVKLHSITFKNLPFKNYYFKFDPLTKDKLNEDRSDAGSLAFVLNSNQTINDGRAITDPYSVNNMIRLTPSDNYVEFNSRASIEGRTVVIGGEISGAPSEKEVRDNVDPRVGRRNTSSDSGAPVTIVNVTETVSAQLQNVDTSYPGIAMVGITLKASDAVSSATDLTLLIKEGRIVRNHLLAGTHQGVATTNSLSYFDEPLTTISGLTGGVSYVRNLETGAESNVKAVSPNSLTCDIGFSPGDRFIVFNVGSSNYFPDIFVDFLINPSGGLGDRIDGDFFIDYPSIVKARRFCVANNFYWDGKIENRQPFATWATEQASFSRLIPMRLQGSKFALLTEDSNEPVSAVFNSSNILRGSYEEEMLPWTENSLNELVLIYTDGNSLVRSNTSVVVRTPALEANQVNLTSITVNAPSITTQEQATSIAVSLFNAKRLQNKAVRFQTDTQGLFLAPGDLILVQHQLTEYDYDLSGYVTQVRDYDSGTKSQSFQISREILLTDTSNYTLTIQKKETGEILENLSFSLVQIDNETYISTPPNSLDSTLAPNDLVVIGRNSLSNRKFRIQNIKKNVKGEISIDGINWSEQINQVGDLVIKYY